MSRAENRHHKERVIKNRIKTMKITWPYMCSKAGYEWVIQQAQQKDNPFTRCSCASCQHSSEERAENRRERKAAKLSIKIEKGDD